MPDPIPQPLTMPLQIKQCLRPPSPQPKDTSERTLMIQHYSQINNPPHVEYHGTERLLNGSVYISDKPTNSCCPGLQLGAEEKTTT